MPSTSKHADTPHDRVSAKALREDIDLMLEYLLDSGKPLPVPAGLLAGVRSSGRGRENGDAALIGVHSRLSRAIRPVTPTTLRETERVGRGFGLFVRNAAVNFFVLVAIVSLVAFVAVSIASTLRGKGPDGSTGMGRTWLEDLSILASAGLGTSLYSLRIASRYIQQRTFDPAYNQIYIIRFVVGLLSGTILGYFGEPLLGAAGASQDGATVTLGSAAFALVGGFSADAVVRILQRVSDTLVTLVGGPEAAASGMSTRDDAKVQASLIRRVAELRRHTSSGDTRLTKELDRLLDDLGNIDDLSALSGDGGTTIDDTDLDKDFQRDIPTALKAEKEELAKADPRYVRHEWESQEEHDLWTLTVWLRKDNHENEEADDE